jgi:hypothetical protein
MPGVIQLYDEAELMDLGIGMGAVRLAVIKRLMNDR